MGRGRVWSAGRPYCVGSNICMGTGTTVERRRKQAAPNPPRQTRPSHGRAGWRPRGLQAGGVAGGSAGSACAGRALGAHAQAHGQGARRGCWLARNQTACSHPPPPRKWAGRHSKHSRRSRHSRHSGASPTSLAQSQDEGQVGEGALAARQVLRKPGTVQAGGGCWPQKE